MSVLSSSSVVSVSSTLVAINAGKSAGMTLCQGGFTFVNHSTGQEEYVCQGGMDCKWSFALRRAYFVRDGQAWVAVNSVNNPNRFSAVYEPLEALAEKAFKAFDLPRKQFIKMLDVAYTKALSASIVPERD